MSMFRSGRPYGSQSQQFQQRPGTYDLFVALRYLGTEIDPRITRPLTSADIVTVYNLLNPHPVSLASIPNPSNLDVALSTRALEAGGNLASILAQLDSKTSTLFKATQNIGNTSFAATQTARANLMTKPEREDLTDYGGTYSPNNTGVQVIAGVSGKQIKVFDCGYEILVAGLHYFYFGTSTTLPTLPTTKVFLFGSAVGRVRQTQTAPHVSAAGDSLYIASAVSDANMPADAHAVIE